MKFIDFFAGIGGFRRGLELAGHECVGFCEWDKFATASYTSMHLLTEEQRKYLSKMPLRKRQKEILKEKYRNGEWYENDIRAVDAASLPTADCWCFGAPCQDFSIAGKRAGLDGDRSSLIREIFRLLEEQEEESRPEWIIYENVKGMLSSNKGLDYLSILSEMDRLGYDCEWQNINSKWFVPQNRERIYTIGHLRRYGRRKILPIEGTDRENRISIAGTTQQHRHSDGNVYDIEGIEPTCLVRDYKQQKQISIPVLTLDRAKKRQNGRRFKEDGEPMFALTAQGRHGVAIKVKEATKKGYAVAREGDSINLSVPGSKTRRGRVGKGVAHTLDTSCNQAVLAKVSNQLSVWHEKHKCYIAIRDLIPKECFRLQGWTDDYFEKAAFVNSDSQLYKQAGNGVTVDVVKAIGERI